MALDNAKEVVIASIHAGERLSRAGAKILWEQCDFNEISALAKKPFTDRNLPS